MDSYKKQNDHEKLEEGVIEKQPDLPMVRVNVSKLPHTKADPFDTIMEAREPLGEHEEFWIIFDLTDAFFRESLSKTLDRITKLTRSLDENKNNKFGFIGEGSFVQICAKTANRFTPVQIFKVFGTHLEALEHVRANVKI